MAGQKVSRELVDRVAAYLKRAGYGRLMPTEEMQQAHHACELGITVGEYRAAVTAWHEDIRRSKKADEDNAKRKLAYQALARDVGCGLVILSSYSSVVPVAQSGVIYTNVNRAAVTTADRTALEAMGWAIDREFDGWCYHLG